jgi:hypothetical protein
MQAILLSKAVSPAHPTGQLGQCSIVASTTNRQEQPCRTTILPASDCIESNRSRKQQTPQQLLLL